MTGPFELVGDTDAPVCVDGMCALPPEAVEPEQPDSV